MGLLYRGASIEKRAFPVKRSPRRCAALPERRGRRRQFGPCRRFAPSGAVRAQRDPTCAIARLLKALPAALYARSALPSGDADTTASASYVDQSRRHHHRHRQIRPHRRRRQLRFEPQRQRQRHRPAGRQPAPPRRVLGSASARRRAALQQPSTSSPIRAASSFPGAGAIRGGNVTAFVVTPPIVNNINRIPIERSQLSGVNDMLAAFMLTGGKLDKSLCDHHAHIFTGIERFDLDFRYAKDDVATRRAPATRGRWCSAK